MFALRVIKEFRSDKESPYEQEITNIALGTFYINVSRESTNKFNELLEQIQRQKESKEIRMIITGQNNVNLLIRENTENIRYTYFIMTDSGTTFEKL